MTIHSSVQHYHFSLVSILLWTCGASIHEQLVIRPQRFGASDPTRARPVTAIGVVLEAQRQTKK